MYILAIVGGVWLHIVGDIGLCIAGVDDRLRTEWVRL